MVQTLELQHIRSYENGLFEFQGGVNIIVGPNASGKTNLLESIHMIARGSGFRSSDVEMITFLADWGRIHSTIDESKRIVKLKRKDQLAEKVFDIDGIEKKRLSSTQLMPVVLFEPNHMLLLSGEPERRRTYLDGVLSQLSPVYEKTLRDYKRALQQRNSLLKMPQLAYEQLFLWDVRLSELAGQLVGMRLNHLDVLNERLSGVYRAVSGTEDTLHVTYQSKIDVTASYAGTMLAHLKQHISVDIARGFTTSGPHRDDLGIWLSKQDARVSASRGETRSIVLSLKIAELELIESSHEQSPLLLLDDVFSELDGKRRRMLATALKDYQTFITTTDADVVIDHFSQLCNIIPLES